LRHADPPLKTRSVSFTRLRAAQTPLMGKA
jgi:hypothetical protein